MSSRIPDYTGTSNRAIAIFCWSRTEPDTPRWVEAEKMGHLAAANGFSVLTGGYSGSMEAVSKGARLARDAAAPASATASIEVTGIVLSEIFPDRVREGNQYLTKSRDSTSMLHRIEQLTTMSRYFVILPGTLGTLQELLCIWVQKMLHPSDRASPIIIAFRDPWEKCVRGIAETLQIPDAVSELVLFVDTPDEAMNFILEDDKQRASIESSS